MKSFLFIVIMLVVFSISPGCNNKEESVEGFGSNPEGRIALTVSTDIAPALRSARQGSISAFIKNDQLGLFITDGNIDNDYSGMGISKNLMCYNLDGNTWKFWAQYFLSGNPATVFAYYPYKDGWENPRRIPVEHNSQTDYMYGTHTPRQNPINRNNPVVNLTMKHALSLVQFNIRSFAYPGKCLLNKIEIANAEGKSVFYSEGTMDISTGKITYTSGKNEPIILQNEKTGILQDIPDSPHFDQSVYPKAMVMPLQAFEKYGDLVIRFTINGRVYTRNVTNGAEWKAGTKNTYTVNVTGQDLQIEQVTIEDWIPGLDDMFYL